MDSDYIAKEEDPIIPKLEDEIEEKQISWVQAVLIPVDFFEIIKFKKWFCKGCNRIFTMLIFC